MLAAGTHEARDGRAEMFQMVEDGGAEGVVYDRSILAYYLRAADGPSLELKSGLLTDVNYAFGLPENSRLREPLNRSLLAFQQTSAWEAILFDYLGE